MRKIVQIGPFMKKLQANNVCNLVNSLFSACMSPSPSHSLKLSIKLLLQLYPNFQLLAFSLLKSHLKF